MFNRRLHNLSYVAMGCLYLIYIISCCSMGQVVSDALSPIFLFLITLIFSHSFFVNRNKRVRLMTLALIFAGTAWFICDLCWFFQSHLGIILSETSFLCNYGYYHTNVFLLIAVAVYSTVELKHINKIQVTLDIFTVVFLLFIFMWKIIFKSQNKNVMIMSEDPLSMACFIVDIILLAWVAIWILSVKFSLLDHWQQLFMLGCLVFTITDIAYLYYYYFMEYIPNTLIDQLYLFSFLMILPVTRTTYISKKQFADEEVNENFKVEKTILIFVVPLLYLLYRKELYEIAGIIVSVVILHLFAAGLIKENKLKEKFIALEKETLERLNIQNNELSQLKENIEKEQILLETVFLSMTDGVISVNSNGEIETMNFVAEKIAECSSENVKGKNIREFFEICNADGMAEKNFLSRNVRESGKVFNADDEKYLKNKNGKMIPIEYTISPIVGRKNELQGSLLVFRDFTDKKKRIEKIKFLSSHDQLTGLFNRHFFEEELANMDHFGNLPISIAMIDVNGLKLVNDSFGHEMGDELLRIVSGILEKFSGKNASVSRIGGDEFTILFPKTDEKQARFIKNRLIAEMEECKLESVVVSISIGVSTKTCQKQNIIDTLKEAEIEMYTDKLEESPKMRTRTIKSIYNRLSEMDSYREHFELVGQYCEYIGSLLQYDEDTLAELITAGRLHDIGKIIFESNRKHGLEDLPYQDTYKKHPEAGYHILRASNDFHIVAESILCHHENWDGSGFPRGLKGEGIPVFARIISIANLYAEIISSGSSTAEAIRLIRNASGIQCDPGIAELFAGALEAEEGKSGMI